MNRPAILPGRPASTTLLVQVNSRHMETQDICCLTLVSAHGARLPSFSAGAHVDVHLPNGAIRSYSLCNTPVEDPTHYQIAVLLDHASRGGSKAVHETLLAGTQVRISAPRNHFPLATDAPHHLLLAGGIGVTPLLAMAEQLCREVRPFTLHHCTRSRERTPFLHRLASSAFADGVHHHFDDGSPSQHLDFVATLKEAPANTHVYTCGPQGFIDAVLNAGRTLGWSEDRMHREYFAASPAPSRGARAFDLRLSRSGRVIEVGAGQSALAALREAGVDVPMSCEQGICGTCLTRVSDGIPDHRDQFLTTVERTLNDRFLPCCSRAHTPCLVLDL